jgi:FtsH-binding integral membrane protein
VTQARTADGRSRPDFLARFQSALPLSIVYFALAALYAWQASRHPVPTIFTDELELTQLSRAIAETGEPARRGEPYGLATLVAYVLAPAWWLGSATASYATAKLMLVLAMTATLFPAYGLARLVVSRWYALAAAGAATAVPAFAYSSILVEEPLAYPLATLALWLIARTLEAPSWGRLAAAAAVCVAAAWTRTQLAILFAVLALGLLWLAWESAPVRRWRSTWTRWDWVGAVTVLLGAVLGFSAIMGHLSTSWRNTTFLYKDRIFEHASWAVGALAIGIGVLPLIVGVAALARPKGEPRDPATSAFVITSVAALATFVWYAGIKGAYVSTVFATYVYERNVIYLAPLLFAGTALAFARGVGRAWAIVVAAVAALYVVNAVPIVLEYPYYEAHGLSILAFANRELGWSEDTIAGVLVVVSLVALAIVVALRLMRRGSPAFATLAGVAALVVVGWTMTTQVYAAEGERILSKQTARNFPKPYDWVEQAVGGGSVVVIGQQISDPTNVILTEFFNPSVRKMWSLDGSAIETGAPILTPDLDATDGTLTPPPGTDYALAVNGVALQAPIVAQRKNAVLYRLDGKPIKLREALIGRETDGWMVAESGERVARASYTRYDVSGDGPGFAVVELTRIGWCPSPGKRGVGVATVRLGPVTIGPDKQPAIEHATQTRRFVVPDCKAKGVTLGPPNEPWRLEVTVAPTFRPREIDPSKSDNRQLGAVIVKAGFQPLFGP